MKQSVNNPPSNDLPREILEKDVLDAVTDSGYPLQTRVAAWLLSNGFKYVDEEWPYFDTDTRQTREIDIFASRTLEGTDLVPLLEKSVVEPSLNLMFECKQSKLPYVFFLCQSTPWVDHFPILAGLRERFVTVSGLASYDYIPLITPVVNALGLNSCRGVSHQFITQPSYSMSFSKCVRRSNRIELSGTEAYNGLVLPLVKAMQHFEDIMRPKRRSKSSLDCHLTLGIGILDAPITAVLLSARDSEPNMLRLPFVRVARRGAMESPLLDQNTGTFAIDIVHRRFLEEYIMQHLFPFFLDVAKLVMQHSEVLRTGEGHGVEDETGRIQLKGPRLGARRRRRD
jgi:hypothetical protein